MNFARILRHLVTGRMALRRLFSDSALAAIEQAIEVSETSHGGEIRVCGGARIAFAVPA